MSGLLTNHRWTLAVVLWLLTTSTALPDGSTRETPLVRAVRQSQRSVVNIHTEKTAPDDTESRFFSAKSRKVTGMGTGLVIDERGYIVTNYHVIQDVELITVTFADGATFEARTISFDRKQDLAIIHVTAGSPLAVMQMGTSSDLMLAETVYAVGNAFGYEHSVSAGIISALNRDVEVDETQAYENLIQTDASINPGNSGGPLLNLDGEVIGINVAIRSGAQRIGFAIPIDDARRTIARLLSVEKLNGLSHGLVTTDIKSARERKLRVDRVLTGSAGELCGLQSGDVICSVHGQTIVDGTDLERSLLDLPRGRIVDVVVDRDGRKQTLRFTVGVGRDPVPPVVTASRPATTVNTATPAVTQAARGTNSRPSPPSAEPPFATAESSDEQAIARAWEILGLQLSPLSDAEREEITSRTFQGLKQTIRYRGGLRVVSVRTNSTAAQFVKAGDVLLALDGYEALGADNLRYILSSDRMQAKASMKCQVWRSGNVPLEGTITLMQQTGM
jgi:serine protease Do